MSGVTVTQKKAVSYAIRKSKEVSNVAMVGHAAKGDVSSLAEVIVTNPALYTKSGDVNQLDSSGVSALFIATLNGKVNAVKLLLKSNANPNIPTKKSQIIPFAGYTALHAAAQMGHIEIMQLLLDSGANVDQVTESNVSPLYLAAECGQVEAAKLLNQHQANLDQATNDGLTPLSTAVQFNRTSVVKYLLSLPLEIDKPNKEGITPLGLACLNGHLEIAKRLILAGADFLSPPEHAPSFLYLTALANQLPLADLLISLNVDINKGNSLGITPTQIAANEGNSEIILKLASHGADLNLLHGNATALFLAAQKGKIEAAEVLILAGADINKPTHSGLTPLWIASQNGHNLVVNLLIAARADVNRASYTDNSSPLYVAALKNRVDIVTALLEVPHLNMYPATTSGAFTPLCAAAEHDCIASLQALLAKQPDTLKKKEDIQNALSLAARQAHPLLTEELKKTQKALSDKDKARKKATREALKKIESEYDDISVSISLHDNQNEEESAAPELEIVADSKTPKRKKNKLKKDEEYHVEEQEPEQEQKEQQSTTNEKKAKKEEEEKQKERDKEAKAKQKQEENQKKQEETQKKKQEEEARKKKEKEEEEVRKKKDKEKEEALKRLASQEALAAVADMMNAGYTLTQALAAQSATNFQGRDAAFAWLYSNSEVIQERKRMLEEKRKKEVEEAQGKALLASAAALTAAAPKPKPKEPELPNPLPQQNKPQQHDPAQLIEQHKKPAPKQPTNQTPTTNTQPNSQSTPTKAAPTFSTQPTPKKTPQSTNNIQLAQLHNQFKEAQPPSPAAVQSQVAATVAEANLKLSKHIQSNQSLKLNVQSQISTTTPTTPQQQGAAVKVAQSEIEPSKPEQKQTKSQNSSKYYRANKAPSFTFKAEDTKTQTNQITSTKPVYQQDSPSKLKKPELPLYKPSPSKPRSGSKESNRKSETDEVKLLQRRLIEQEKAFKASLPKKRKSTLAKRKELNRELICGYCLNFLNQPVTLVCRHSYCKNPCSDRVLQCMFCYVCDKEAIVTAADQKKLNQEIAIALNSLSPEQRKRFQAYNQITR